MYITSIEYAVKYGCYLWMESQQQNSKHKSLRVRQTKKFILVMFSLSYLLKPTVGIKLRLNQ